MARIAANPRIEPDVLVRGVWELMIDAMDLPYIEFERRALTWETLADPDGAAEKLERNQQRRADALLAMAHAAAANPPGRSRPLPTVNFLLDENTAATVADGQPLNPDNYRTVVSRTDRGNPINPDAIIGVSLWALIRRVITNSASVVIDKAEPNDSSPATPATPSCSWSPPASGPAATNHTPGVTPTTSPAGPPAAPPTPTTAHHSAHATTTSKKPASPSGETTTATGTSPHPTAPPSADTPKRA